MLSERAGHGLHLMISISRTGVWDTVTVMKQSKPVKGGHSHKLSQQPTAHLILETLRPVSAMIGGVILSRVQQQAISCACPHNRTGSLLARLYASQIDFALVVWVDGQEAAFMRVSL